MFFGGSRSTVPSSRYGGLLSIMEITGWTLEECLAQPEDLIEEFLIRLQKRALADKKRADEAKRKAAVAGSKSHGGRR